MLSALRDGQRGKYRVVVNPGPLSTEHSWTVVGDGTAVRETTTNRNFIAEGDSLHVHTPSDYFEACLEFELGGRVLECLAGVGLEPADSCPVCVLDREAVMATVPLWRAEADYVIRNDLNFEIRFETIVDGRWISGVVAPRGETLVLHVEDMSWGELLPSNTFSILRVLGGNAGRPIYEAVVDADWSEESRTRLVLVIDETTSLDGPRCNFSNVGFDTCKYLWASCKPALLDQQGQPFDGPADPAFATTLDEIHCFLRAARDNERLAHTFITEYDAGQGINPRGDTRYSWSLLGDGTAVIARTRDLAPATGPVEEWAVTLTAPYFETCLTHDFGPALFDCLTGEGLGEPITCPICPRFPDF